MEIETEVEMKCEKCGRVQKQNIFVDLEPMERDE